MPHPLQQRVQSLGRRAKALLLAYGAAWCVALTLTAAAIAALVDYALRLQNPAARAACTLMVLGVFGWSVVRFLWPAIAWRPAEVQVARQIERWRPQLAGKLSSAVAFLHVGDLASSAGSAELRSAVVAEAAEATRDLRLADCLDARTTRIAIAAACLALALAAGLALADHHSALVALRRLAAPWGADSWPRRNHLAFENPPQRIATGDDVLLVLVDERGNLPQEVFIEYLYEDEPDSAAVVEPMTRQGDKTTHRLENVARPLKFRAFGGDDDAMPWLVLGVEEPPQIVSLQLRLKPPDYTGWPERSAEKEFAALRGTRVAADGRVDRPLRSVRLRQGTDGILSTPVLLHGDGLGFSVPFDAAPPWELDKSGSYWFEIVDNRDLAGGQSTRIDAQLIEDLPPSALLQQPRGDVVATPAASVQVRASVKDDLAIEKVQIRFRRADQRAANENEEQEDSIDLSLQPAPTSAAAAADSAGRRRGEQRNVAHAWELDDFEPGAVIEWSIVAIDNREQTGASGTRRIRVVSSAEFADHVARREEQILKRLAESLRMARTARDSAGAVRTALADAGAVSSADLHRLQAAELAQRDLRKSLAEGDDSALAAIESLLADLQSNGAGHSETALRVANMRAKTASLTREWFPQVEQHLASALKSLRIALQDDANSSAAAADRPDRSRRRDQLASEAASALQAAALAQDETISILEQLVGRLAQHDSLRQIGGELDRIEDEQRRLRSQTGELRSATLARSLDELDADQRARLFAAAERQFELAQSLAGSLERLGKAAADSSADNEAAANAARALDFARQAALDGQMRRSAQYLQANEVGSAASLQDEIVGQLAALKQWLADRGSESAAASKINQEQLLDGLRRAVAIEQDLLGRTSSLQQQRLAQNGELTAPQAQSLRELASEQSEGAANVGRLRAAAPEVIGAVLQEAAGHMASAGELLASGVSDESAQHFQLRALQRLQQLLAAARQPPADNQSAAADTPSDSASQQPAPGDSPQASAAELRLLRIMQADLQQRTAALDELLPPNEAISDELQKQQSRLAQDQGRLAELTTRIAERATSETAPRKTESDSGRSPVAPQAPPKSSFDLLEGLDDLRPPASTADDSPSPPPVGEDIGAGPAGHSLELISRRMRIAQSSIEQGDTSAKTQTLQGQIIAELAALASQAQQREAEQQAQQAATTGQGTEPGEAPAGESSSQQKAPVAAAPSDASESIKQVWGHLPPEVRERVINGGFSEFLPDYERMIEEYYRRLADPEQQR